MNDRVLQDGSGLIQRTMLSSRDLEKRSSVRRLGRQAQSLIENVGWNTVRVRHIAYGHPSANRLILVVVPIDRFVYGAEGVESGESQDQQKHQGNQPLLPAEVLQRSEYAPFHRELICAICVPRAKARMAEQPCRMCLRAALSSYYRFGALSLNTIG